jgi:hypothetical protein
MDWQDLAKDTDRWRVLVTAVIKKWNGGMDWQDLAKDTDRWRVLVNAVINLRLSQNTGNFLIS